MTQQEPGPQSDQLGPGPSGLARVGQGLAVLVVLAAAVVSALLGSLVLASAFGEASRDPHGYGLVFGSLSLVPTALVGALALPFVARADQPRARRWALWGALVWVVAALGIAGYALLGA